MAINLKENIWIEGFNTSEELYKFKDSICFVGEKEPYIYLGKLLEIPEELAKSIVETIPHIYGGIRITDNCGNDVLFKNYKINEFVKRSGIRSIKSACIDKYCIIYKK